MDDDAVPEGLLDAFVRRSDGGYGVRRFFGRDLGAAAAALFAPIVFMALIFLVVVLLFLLVGDAAGQAAEATASGLG